MKKNFKLYIGLAALALATSCKPSLDEFEPAKGSADFSQFIAVGNSLTSGYADNGLYLAGQRVAFPNLMAEQFKTVGGGAFTSPFFSEAEANGSGYLRLKGFDENGSPETEFIPAQAERGKNALGNPLYTKHTDPIQNLGVPGMRLDLAFAEIFGSQFGNPYFERLLPENQVGKTTYMQYAVSQEHTFFSFWLGNNDVLGYSMNGAAATDDPTKTMISVAQFTQLYNAFINGLTAKQQKGVVATIPDVTVVPFFNTVTLQMINAGLAANPATANLKLLIKTKAGVRPAEEGDLFGLTFRANIARFGQNGYGFSPLNPIEDSAVLDKAEVAEVLQRIKELNAVIKQVADSKDLALADVNAFLNKVKAGYNYNGVHISAAFITGNAFSLDGIHLTPIGNAVVANVFIDAINAKYNSKVPKIDVSKYGGVSFPN
ncbi:SGNH/GDSL hydrolase family protein [Sphingobacterium lactis]